MKQGDKKYGWSLLLIFAAPLLVALATAFAQDSAKKTSSYAPVDIKESFDTVRTRMIVENPHLPDRLQRKIHSI